MSGQDGELIYVEGWKEPFRVIPESEIPPSQSGSKPRVWLARFQHVPHGKAWEITEDDAKAMGVKMETIQVQMSYYVSKGKLPKTFRSHVHVDGNGVRTLYIVNERQEAVPDA